MKNSGLDEAIQTSGLKIDYIVEKLGISRQAFHKKRHGLIKFNDREKQILCDVLKVKDSIFLP